MGTLGPLAPDARRVRVVCLGSDAQSWRVVGEDGTALCEVMLSISVRARDNRYHILTPDEPPGLLGPRHLHDDTFARGSPWWTPAVLRAALDMIVRKHVAPAAVVTFEGVPPG